MDKRDEIRLLHMRDALIRARGFIEARQRADLDVDYQLRYALLYALQTIGEAADGISTETQVAHSEIEWTNIIGMRHRLVHGYDAVNIDIVWQVSTEELPELLQQLNSILDDK